MAVTKTVQGFLAGIRARRLQRVQELADAMNDGDSVLTHCNVSGELAMAASLAAAAGKRVKFYATETRPYMQGAKLTVWELQQAGASVTLVPDNAVGSLMADRRMKGLKRRSSGRNAGWLPSPNSVKPGTICRISGPNATSR